MDGSLDGSKINGKIVLCSNDKDKEYFFAKQKEIKKLGGIGFILIDDDFRVDFQDFKDYPATVVTSKDATEIFSYINSTR